MEKMVKAAAQRLVDLWQIMSGCDTATESGYDCWRDANTAYQATLKAYQSIGMVIQNKDGAHSVSMQEATGVAYPDE